MSQIAIKTQIQVVLHPVAMLFWRPSTFYIQCLSILRKHCSEQYNSEANTFLLG